MLSWYYITVKRDLKLTSDKRNRWVRANEVRACHFLTMSKNKTKMEYYDISYKLVCGGEVFNEVLAASEREALIVVRGIAGELDGGDAHNFKVCSVSATNTWGCMDDCPF